MQIEKVNGVFYLKGEFDIFHTNNVEAELLEAHNMDEDMILDFSGVSFMDSTGLGILISLSKELEQTGKKVIIQNVTKRIKKVFEITELDKVFGINE
ncbi:MAG: STAS domain-containing protein [Ezakiella sp.]|nr:STAS domain-containing protein [Ezakiella sp.]MDD7471232.1 STAS domain-containing protein [Bacillota bacterium]MDY3923369.1 STAS domain-containing protein [Ezakiella sp.]